MQRVARGAAGLLVAVGVMSTAWGHGGHTVQDSGAAGPVSASQCWIRQLPAPVPSGGFLHIHNAGSTPVVLKSVQSPDYGQVMMHQTTESGGMSSMSAVQDLQVPAGGDVDFAPGHYHLMLEQPRAGLKVGDTVQMHFELADGGSFTAACEVRPPSAMSADMKGMGDAQDMHHHHGMH